jgi:hypothetical protein
MELFFQHSESGSGHADDYETITLEGDGDVVVLSINNSSGTVKEVRGSRTSRYAITPDTLIDLIKKHGKSI